MSGDNFEKKSFLAKIMSGIKPDAVFVLLFSAYIIANTKNLLVFKSGIYDVETNASFGLIGFVLSVLAVFAVLFLLYLVFIRGIKNFHRYVLFFSSAVYAITLVAHKNLDIAYNIVVCAILAYVINYCFSQKGDGDECGISFEGLDLRLNFKVLLALIAMLVIAFVAVLSEACILRHKIFYASTYDFGIFAQMFENMAKTGLQVTSVERNMQMSHFAVHFSPIYYLLLPIYLIFRSPECLIVMQAVAAALGAFPLALIAKKFGLSHTNILLLAIAYLLYPALGGGLFFDFHENKFLTVLILWLLYFMVSEGRAKKYILIYVFAALVLIVKEDAFLYVLCAGLYYMFKKNSDGRLSKKNMIHGGALAALSIAYFMFSTYYLKTYGLGVMTYRYNLFLGTGEESFGAMIANVIKNPALLLSSLLSVPEKFEYVLFMLIPLCFLPFVGKKLDFVFLIVPMVIMNLATNYIYQYDVNFQYTYGVTALLFFLAVKNLSQIDKKQLAKLCVAMACFSAVLFSSKIVNRIHSYNYIYYARRGEFVETAEMLKEIPMDASVSACTFLVSHLIEREEVYMVELFDPGYFDYDTDYLINDLRGVDVEQYKNFLEEIAEHGYKKIDESVFVEVFIKKESER
ncbi:MAG: DUF2079 domain-containing protein [Oscillospiraceae bacterium]|nr:DUF2079 domain-containing protein [Oscillospiraceae bacterium]